jgi:hypothetical protein
MNPLIAKSKYIVQEEGIQVFLDRALRALIVRVKRCFTDIEPDFERWTRIKDSYKGKRAFLIGNGPSLNSMPLYLLRNEFTIGFNRINLLEERLDWLPTFYATIDDRVLLDSVHEISNDLSRYKYVFLPDLHPYNINFRKKFPPTDNLLWLFLDKLEFSSNLPYAGINKTVANVGLQILAYMGFSPIYIIGVDLEYSDHKTVQKLNKRDWVSSQDDDPNHFDPRYFGKGRAYHHPRMEETFVRFEEGKRFFDKLGVEIYNAGVRGKLNVFPRVEFRELFHYTPSEELKLFLQACGKEGNFDSLEAAFPDAEYIQAADEWSASRNTVIAGEAVGLKLINRAVFTHVPHGPFDGKYVFRKRC